MGNRVVIAGAGMGGLASAIVLAARGVDVILCEKENSVGGKARQVAVDGAKIDGGPTVFTMREVFDELFDEAGSTLESQITVHRAERIARHAWDEQGVLDLYDDLERSEQAIAEFAGGDAAAGYRAFHAEAANVYRILDKTFLRDTKISSPAPLMWRIGLTRMNDLNALRPYETLWKVLGEHFVDPRLRQLFGRYSTYCGSSPFETPATLMLIARVEARGVWLIEGGMSALAEALKRVAEALGVQFRMGEAVERIEVTRGRASGVMLASGERIEADAVICNADPAALGEGLFGEEAGRAVTAVDHRNRSLSALVWTAHATTRGFPLDRHNVFFSPDYAREFREIRQGTTPSDPSVYLCAQDRGGPGDAPTKGHRERIQIIVNAPADGDTHDYSAQEMERCTQAMRASLSRCGLELEEPLPHSLATPETFEALFPSTGGALYGRASHGWAASFLRQGAKTRIPGLFCAGGSTHPGAGVPMAALSGRLAANEALRVLASTQRLHRAATAGGTSMPSATTADTG